MKNIAFATLVLFLASCGGGSELEKKKAELAQYKSTYEELKGKIEKLEKEIALLDTAKVAQKAKLVSIKPVDRGGFAHFVDLQGAVESDENVAVQPGMPGLVTRVYVKEGDMVSAGKV
jgi:multidrug efflux pump subunit AcrA (membrane-fusion protein)